MKHPQLKVEARTVLGKKVKKLRREGLLPANIYGKELKSTAVQLPLKDFQTVYDEVHETGLIDVMLDGKTRPVLIKNVHIDTFLHRPLHADFYQVNLKEKVKSMVPVVITGEPKAVTEKIGMLIQLLNEIEVEALPEDLPENIEIDVTPLATVDDQITVDQLKVAKAVTVHTDAGQVVVKINELVSEEAKEQAAAEAATSAEAKAEGEEDAAPTEGEAKTEPASRQGGEGSKEEKPAEEK